MAALEVGVLVTAKCIVFIEGVRPTSVYRLGALVRGTDNQLDARLEQLIRMNPEKISYQPLFDLVRTKGA